MCNIIIESNTIENISSMLKTDYKESRVGIIIGSNDISRYRQYLRVLKGLNIEVFLCDVQLCNTAVIDEFKDNMKGIECIIAMGKGCLIDISKAVANKINVPLYIILTDVITLNITNDYFRINSADNIMLMEKCTSPIAVYVDIDILGTMSSREIANGFAYLLSCNLFICKMLYDDINREDIEIIDKMLGEIRLFTVQNILTVEGRKRLMKLLFELSLFADKFQLNEFMSNLVAIYSKFYQDELLIGERFTIFAMIILTLHEKLVGGDIGMGQFDISKRLARLNALFHNHSYEVKMVDNMCKDNDYINHLRNNKEYYYNKLTKCVSRVMNNISMLKRIYVDKGVMYNKVDISKYINSLSLLSDMAEDKMFVVLRDFGVLDNI